MKEKFKEKIRGFTLIEFIVLIVSLGATILIILYLMGFIKMKSAGIKFKEYEDYLILKASQYVSEHEEDLFYDSNGGCSYISYNDLVSVGLSEKINNKISCSGSGTFVRVIKIGDKYKYKAYLGCFDKKSKKSVYISPKSDYYHSYDHASCGGVDVSNNIRFTTSLKPEINYSLDKDRLNVIISNLEGIRRDVRVDYSFSFKNDDFRNLEFKSLNFNELSYSEQMKLIDNDEEITVKSNDILIPRVIDKDIYLVLKVLEVRDLNNRLWVNRDNGSSYKVIGLFRFN